MVEALQGKTIAGTLAIGRGSSEACVDIVHACKGRKFVSLVSSSVPIKNFSDVSLQAKCRLRCIRTKFIFGSTLMDNEVSRVIYEDFLPSALAEGRYLAAPEPDVVGTGLECIQAALDTQKKGVSAKKVVVSL